jgi:hypothetical protein
MREIAELKRQELSIKPKPSCKLPPVVERTAIRDCCDHGCGRYRPDPFHGADALTKRVSEPATY